MDSIIKLNNIEKSYTNGKVKNQVLTDFSWNFERNCFTVLAGPSGSGKSSLLNILATLDRPDSGIYILDGQIINFEKKKELTRLRKENFGFIFQSFNLIPVLSALENVELPLTLFKYREKERYTMAEEALTLVGLRDKINKRPYEMSGGEQQRVAIARAIARHPKIIFADEPTANLDRKNAWNIVHLMKDLNEKEGLSFVIASHDEKVIQTGKEVIQLGE
ncbi:putative ABC transport system ATP-binding protein [Dysgonomonas sp. PFB1-18]|uniref:ABC transporter ATP-binding protein n=1 Tax=unclassified Dysgonomonas TaxID=2630389 RepID=UPI002476ADDC|nr:MULTISPECIES: ABC transporter ATP-binding protein [unclassified Dysgonomonas]MDH6309419.1 putative ABC transport system ATP-binding protein [Dysgonomonas sp. PF1-14]MDH6339716.1 putative ABC transport system ATP-binding protein [Dysgonomonas sp. PF1-16]MDH6381364.1 putative ABC transport system ATP-binding protein [Dysgonomonas sp. PFB1-18]MDH6398579.1 putative ABC transport system ATP-binding protein [Dysgonomonas sp. PF1-23]